MNLAIQTDGPVCILTLLDSSGRLLVSDQWESGRELSDSLLERIKTVIAGQGGGIHDLTGILVHSGPGSFTSLRIGHTVANSLASSLGIPVVGGRGEAWLMVGLKALVNAPIGVIAMPFYGAEANISKPKA